MPNLIYLKLSPKTCLYIQLQESTLTHTFTYYCTMRQWILNKYLICFLIFLVWMTFFDRNNFIYQHENRTQLQVMEQERQYYEDQIKENEKELQELLTNKETLEKFAREKYLMKKDNEEIFVILKEEKVINKSWWEKFKDRVVSIFG